MNIEQRPPSTAPTCPMGRGYCEPEKRCAWRVGGECAVTMIAKALYRGTPDTLAMAGVRDLLGERS